MSRLSAAVLGLWGVMGPGLAGTVAQAQGWPALENAEFVTVGGGLNDAAVIIGIDDYYQLPDVVGAEANAQAWERWLRSGRKVPARNIRLLVGQVDKDQVRTAVADAAAKVGADGTLYFVFVGHGGPARTARGHEPHLLMADTKRTVENFAERGVAVESELSVWLQPASAKGAKVLAVLDACFTGKAQGGGDLVAGAQFAALSSMATPAALTVLSATSSNDITGPLPGASRPAFSYLVLAAMRGWGDANEDGKVTASEAVDFATGVMRDAMRAEQPEFKGADLVLGKSGGEATPAYRGWLGRAKAAIVPVAAGTPLRPTEPLAFEPIVGTTPAPISARAPSSENAPTVDADGDGIGDAQDQCPFHPEDKDGFEDSDGCPDPDNDKDGISDAQDRCPNEAENINGFKDEDGCPDAKVASLMLPKIEVLQKVHFESAKSTISRASYVILDGVAEVLAGHAEIRRLRVEGHTSSVGADRFNQQLSEQRAEAVRAYLIGKGIDRNRIEAVGHGETRPIDDNRTPLGRARNNRVEFVIVDQGQ